MESQDNKPHRKRVQREEIGKQNSRTAEILKELINQATQTRITADIAPLREHTGKLIRELKKTGAASHAATHRT